MGSLRQWTRSIIEDSAYIPHQKCVESARKWIRSSIEDLCLYSLREVNGITEEMDLEPHRRLLLIFCTIGTRLLFVLPIKVYGIT